MVRLRIKEVATERGFTQQKPLREAAQVTTTQFEKMWHNHLQRVDLGALGRIAKVLGVQPGDLLIVDDEAG